MSIKRTTYLQTALLELLCYVPVVIIIGNILPSIAFVKIHWVYIGVIFIVSLLIHLLNKRTYGLLIILCFFAIMQLLTSIAFLPHVYIDFIAGPLVLVAVVNTILNDDIQIMSLKRYRTKFLIGLSIPIIISFLQYVEILPLEFMNAKYINVTMFGSEILKRVNGFLYHGIELAVIIFFFFVNLVALRHGIKAYLTLIVMIFLEFIIVIKAAILTAIFFAVYYGYFVDRRLRSIKSILIGLAIFGGFSYLYLLIPDIRENRLNFDPREFEFPDQLFTGRGFIWNTYLRGVRDFNLWQITFGGGFGSAPRIFQDNLIGTAEQRLWSPGPHNQLLEWFINGGVFAIWLVFYILKKQYKKLKIIFQDHKSDFFFYYAGVILIPLVLMGLTAPIMSMFVYWSSLSAFLVTLKIKYL